MALNRRCHWFRPADSGALRRPATGDGDYILTVKVEDRAGNVKQSAPLTVTVDTHIAIDRIELVNDSGIPGDNLTNEARPHFQVTVPADVNGVRLSIDGGKTWFDATQSATSGVWDYTADECG